MTQSHRVVLILAAVVGAAVTGCGARPTDSAGPGNSPDATPPRAYAVEVAPSPRPVRSPDEVVLLDAVEHRYPGGEGQGAGMSAPAEVGKIRLIRLRHADKAWDKNFGVGGDRNLLTELRTREPKMAGKVANETEAIDIATLGTLPATKSPPLVYVGGAYGFNPTADEKMVLRNYLTRRHGMILGDNLGGSGFHDDFIAAMDQITGVKSVEIARDDRIHQTPYELPVLPYVVAHGGTVPRGWKVDGRWVAYYHPGALSDAWRDDRAGVKKDVAELCFQLGINIVFYAHVQYGRWAATETPAAEPPVAVRPAAPVAPPPKKNNPFDGKDDDLLKDLK